MKRTKHRERERESDKGGEMYSEREINIYRIERQTKNRKIDRECLK